MLPLLFISYFYSVNQKEQNNHHKTMCQVLFDNNLATYNYKNKIFECSFHNYLTFLFIILLSTYCTFLSYFIRIFVKGSQVETINLMLIATLHN